MRPSLPYTPFGSGCSSSAGVAPALSGSFCCHLTARPPSGGSSPSGKWQLLLQPAQLLVIFHLLATDPPAARSGRPADRSGRRWRPGRAADRGRRSAPASSAPGGGTPAPRVASGRRWRPPRAGRLAEFAVQVSKVGADGGEKTQQTTARRTATRLQACRRRSRPGAVGGGGERRSGVSGQYGHRGGATKWLSREFHHPFGARLPSACGTPCPFPHLLHFLPRPTPHPSAAPSNAQRRGRVRIPTIPTTHSDGL